MTRSSKLHAYWLVADGKRYHGCALVVAMTPDRARELADRTIPETSWHCRWGNAVANEVRLPLLNTREGVIQSSTFRI